MVNNDYILIAIVLGLIAAALGYWRKRTVSAGTKKKSGLIFTTSQAPEAVINAIVSFASRSSYSLDQVNREASQIMLGEKATAFSNGFYYPIQVNATGNTTVIEVGQVSKTVQIGPIPQRHHQKLFEAVRSAVIAEERAYRSV